MFHKLSNEIDLCQLFDRHRLERKLAELRKLSNTHHSYPGKLQALTHQIAQSTEKVRIRSAAIPANITFPENLPVSGSADEIAALVMSNQVVVIAGDTGSGKTTQIPKICLRAGLGRIGPIGHTQPRRLAAVSVAGRIAEELKVELGEGVGYQVRFNEKVSDRSFLKLMTDGILLAELQQDRFLNRYEVLIIDEAHERSLNIDFLLGFLTQLLAKRRDLKLIITSATIDVDKFSKHFNDAPIIKVSGRSYPVETVYAPLEVVKDDQPEDDLQADAIINAVREIIQMDRKDGSISGDVLVFLSSEREIRDTATKLRKQKFPNLEVLPLYARLSHKEQLKVFQPRPGRKIVLATNVAETSITVPGINYVIDTGFARISRYSMQSKVQRLPIEAVSQASANQRKGRCGRLANGVCIRLYAEADFEGRREFTDPEIKRTNLASVILKMKHLRLGTAESFPFIDAPEQKAINEGIKLLSELHALTPKLELTDCGRKMARLPVDPRYARMLVIAHQQRCLTEMLIIVSALSIQDPREVYSENRQLAAQKLAHFDHDDSDFLTMVNLWNGFEKERQSLNQNQLRKYCKSHFLSYMRMREWREVHRQLLLSSQELGFTLNKNVADYRSVHQSIIGGSLNQVACNVERGTYLGSRNKRFSLFSTSVLGRKSCKWIVTGPLIETSQIFASQAAKIEPEWVEQMALHLVKRSYFEPHWSKKRQQVMAYEKVHLYGLAIIEKSLIQYSDIDAVVSRQIFVEQGLLGDQLRTNAKFCDHNKDFLAELIRQEEKMRRPDIIVNDRDISHFYESRLPVSIDSTAKLEAWLNEAPPANGDSLLMTQETLLDSDSNSPDASDFPDSTSLLHNELVLDYVFKPGTEEDGATIEVPAAILEQLGQADLDWAVPGYIRDKCIALLKGLPKASRKQFIPVSGFVDEVLPLMSPKDGDLIDSLLAQIKNSNRARLSRQDFDAVEIPDHLQVKVRLLNDEGDTLAFDSSLTELKKNLGTRTAQPEMAAGVRSSFSHPMEKQGIQDWDFGDLPEQLTLGDDLVLVRYPALVDQEESISIVLHADKQIAKAITVLGLTRLYMFRSVQQRNLLRKKFTRLINDKALKLPGELDELVVEAIRATYIEAFQIEQQHPRTQSQFEELLESNKSRLILIGEKIEGLLLRSIDEVFEINRTMRQFTGSDFEYVREDITKQLQNLIYPGFLSDAGYCWFAEYPRYMAAIKLRLEKAPHMGDKDRQLTEALSTYRQRYLQCQANRPDNSVDVALLRWMIEEFRVSIFAQNLGTKISVSQKRLDKQIDKIML